MSVRQAQIVAISLNVLCPYCGEPQPNRDDGSEQWLPLQVAMANHAGANECVSCERKFRIFPQQHVGVSPMTREQLRDAVRVALARLEIAHERLKAEPNAQPAIDAYDAACVEAKRAFLALREKKT